MPVVRDGTTLAEDVYIRHTLSDAFATVPWSTRLPATRVQPHQSLVNYATGHFHSPLRGQLHAFCWNPFEDLGSFRLRLQDQARKSSLTPILVRFSYDEYIRATRYPRNRYSSYFLFLLINTLSTDPAKTRESESVT